MKMTEQNDITHTCSHKPGYLNLYCVIANVPFHYFGTKVEQYSYTE